MCGMLWEYWELTLPRAALNQSEDFCVNVQLPHPGGGWDDSEACVLHHFPTELS